MELLPWHFILEGPRRKRIAILIVASYLKQRRSLVLVT